VVGGDRDQAGILEPAAFEGIFTAWREGTAMRLDQQVGRRSGDRFQPLVPIVVDARQSLQ
jgi:hypothetical protein